MIEHVTHPLNEPCADLARKAGMTSTPEVMAELADTPDQMLASVHRRKILFADLIDEIACGQAVCLSPFPGFFLARLEDLPKKLAWNTSCEMTKRPIFHVCPPFAELSSVRTKWVEDALTRIPIDLDSVNY